MDSKSVVRLGSFLSQFNTTDLGDGDLVAGANTLAAHLCSMANLSRPGSGIMSKNERSFEIGANLVISGGLSSSLCKEHIGSQLAQYQNSYNSHSKGFLRAAEEDQKKGIARHEWSDLAEYKGTSSEGTFFGLQQEDHLSIQTTGQEWEYVLSNPPQPTRGELYQNTQVYLRTSEPNKAVQCLAPAHDGKLFLHYGMQSPKQFRNSQSILGKVIDGYNVGSSPPSIHQGSVLVEDSCNSFYQVVRDNPDSFPRFIWLLDGGRGMNLPQPPATTTTASKPVELRHLRQSLLTAFARRVDHHQVGPQFISRELSRLQTKWVRFLLTQEDDYPGITGFSKSLLATLFFGLQGVSNAYFEEHRQSLNATGIYEFAQYLILRSVAARKSLLWAEEIEKNRHLKARLVLRLQSKALENREIYRSLCIPASKCEELLSDLEQDGAVQRENNRWTLTSEQREKVPAIELVS